MAVELQAVELEDHDLSQTEHLATDEACRNHCRRAMRRELGPISRSDRVNGRTWQQRHGRQSYAESRNAIQTHLGLNRAPWFGLAGAAKASILGDTLTLLSTVARFAREASHAALHPARRWSGLRPNAQLGIWLRRFRVPRRPEIPHSAPYHHRFAPFSSPEHGAFSSPDLACRRTSATYCAFPPRRLRFTVPEHVSSGPNTPEISFNPLFRPSGAPSPRKPGGFYCAVPSSCPADASLCRTILLETKNTRQRTQWTQMPPRRPPRGGL